MSVRCVLCLWGRGKLGGEIGVCCGRIGIEVVSHSILWNKSYCFSLTKYKTNEISTRRFIWMMIQKVGNKYSLLNMLNGNLSIGLMDKMQNTPSCDYPQITFGRKEEDQLLYLQVKLILA